MKENKEVELTKEELKEEVKRLVYNNIMLYACIKSVSEESKMLIDYLRELIEQLAKDNLLTEEQMTKAVECFGNVAEQQKKSNELLDKLKQPKKSSEDKADDTTV